MRVHLDGERENGTLNKFFTRLRRFRSVRQPTTAGG
jgi:hypothetical protein